LAAGEEVLSSKSTDHTSGGEDGEGKGVLVLTSVEVQHVLEFWFGTSSTADWDLATVPPKDVFARWWEGGADLDCQISEMFGALVEKTRVVVGCRLAACENAGCDSRTALLTVPVAATDGSGDDSDSRLMAEIEAARPLKLEALAPAKWELLMSQCVAGPHDPTCTEILPGLDVGRAGDITNDTKK
jgi:hypothetical protein